MTDPVDPNEPSPWTPPPTAPYQPPPAFAPPPPPGIPPAYGQPPAQPAYDQPAPHWQQQYGPSAPYGQQPYPSAPYPNMYPTDAYAAPPRRSLRTLYIAFAVVVLVAGGTIIAALASSSSSTHKVALPDMIGAYTRLHSTQSNAVETRIRRVASAQGTPFFNIASLGSYGSVSGDVPNLIVAVLRTSQLPDHSNHTAQEVVDELFLGVSSPGNEPKTEAAGTHGGVVECAEVTFGAAQESVCAWSDSSTTGLTYSVNPPLPTDDLAVQVDLLRDQVD